MRLSPLCVLASACLLLSACGKTPEQIGQQPKQTLDKVQSDVEKAMKKEAERLPEAEKKE